MADIRNADMPTDHLDWKRREAAKTRQFDKKLWQEKNKKDEPTTSATLFGPPIKVNPDSSAKQIANILGEHNVFQRNIGPSLIGVDRNPATPRVGSRSVSRIFPKPEARDSSRKLRPDGADKESTSGKKDARGGMYVPKDGRNVVRDSSASRHGTERGHGSDSNNGRRETSKTREETSRSSSLKPREQQASSSDKRRTSSSSTYNRGKEANNQYKKTDSHNTRVDYQQFDKSSHDSVSEKSRDRREHTEKTKSTASAKPNRSSSTSSSTIREKGNSMSATRGSTETLAPTASTKSQRNHSSSKCPPLTLPNQIAKSQNTMENILKETMLQPPLTAIQTPQKEDGFQFTNTKKAVSNKQSNEAAKKPPAKRLKKVSSSPNLSESSASESDSESHSSGSDSSDDEPDKTNAAAKTAPGVLNRGGSGTKIPAPARPEKEGDRKSCFNLALYRESHLNKKGSSASSSDISPSKESVTLPVDDTPSAQPLSNESVNDNGLDKCFDDIVNGECFKERIDTMLSPIGNSGAHVKEVKPSSSKPPSLNLAPSLVFHGSKVFGLAQIRSQLDFDGEIESDTDMKLNEEPPVLSPKPKSSQPTVKRRSSAKVSDGIPDVAAKETKSQTAKVKSKRPKSGTKSGSKKPVVKSQDTKSGSGALKSPAPTSAKDKPKSKPQAAKNISRKNKTTSCLSQEFISSSDSSDNESSELLLPPKSKAKAVSRTIPKGDKDAGQRTKRTKLDVKAIKFNENTADKASKLSSLSKPLDLKHILEDVTAPGLLSPIPSITNLSLLNTNDRRYPPFRRLFSAEETGLKVKTNLHSASQRIVGDSQSVPVKSTTFARNKSVLNHKLNSNTLQFIHDVPSIPMSIKFALLDMAQLNLLRSCMPETSASKGHDNHRDKTVQDFRSVLHPVHDSKFSPQPAEYVDMSGVPPNPSANTNELRDSKPVELVKPREVVNRIEPMTFSDIVAVQKRDLPSTKIPRKRPDRPPQDDSDRPGQETSNQGPVKRRQASDDRLSNDHTKRKRARLNELSPHSSHGSEYEPRDSQKWSKGSDYASGPTPNTHSPCSTLEYRTPQNDAFSDRESITSKADEHCDDRRHAARNETVRAPDSLSHESRAATHTYEQQERDKWAREPRYRDRGRERVRDRSRERFNSYDRDSRERDRKFRRESGDRDNFDRDRDRPWERDHRRGRDYEHDSLERKRPRNYSRDWDAPREDSAPPGNSEAVFEPPPSISPYHVESTQRVASQWSAISAGHAEQAPSRDARERYNRYDDERAYPRYPPRESKPRVVPLVDPSESADYYLSEARRLKHEGDKMGAKDTQLITYTEAVLSFVMCAYTMEDNNTIQAVKKMVTDTLDLLRFIVCGAASNTENSEALNSRILKLKIFNLRIQALLKLRLYRLKKPETVKLKIIIDDHNNKKSVIGGVHAVSQVPSPDSNGAATSGQEMCTNCTGTPSPMSSQPSPAVSVASVGSPGSSGESQPKMLNGNVSSTTVCVPTRIHSVTTEYTNNLYLLYEAHDTWDKAEDLIDDKEFFARLDEDCGVLSFHSTVQQLVRYIREGSLRLQRTGHHA